MSKASLAKLPRQAGQPFIGNAIAFRDDALGFVSEAALGGPLVEIALPFRAKAYLVSDPDTIHQILATRADHFRKGRLYQRLRPVLGEGLVTAEHDVWRKHRAIAQPLFHPSKLKRMSTAMVQETQQQIERWTSGETIDFSKEMSDLTLRIMTKLMFGSDFVDSSTIYDSVRDINEGLFHWIWSPLPKPEMWPTSATRRLHNANRELRAAVQRIIANRRKQASWGEDLLSQLILAKDEDSRSALSPAALEDEVATFFLAGHETTSSWLTWAAYAIAQNPSVEHELANECLGDNTSEKSDTQPKLAYTRMVLDETLRLYPPVWTIFREAAQSVDIMGHKFPEGSLFMISPWVMHRHPLHWKNPTLFDPENFSRDRRAAHNPGLYFPFGGGPRLCIGINMATIEATMILSTLVRNFSWRLVDPWTISPKPAVTLMPSGPVRMRLLDRDEKRLDTGDWAKAVG